MKLQIKVDDKGIISDVRFKTFGCGSAIASSSYMTERVKGMSLEDAGRIKNTEIAKELCLPPVKLHCSMLAEDAIKAAIRDYHAKVQGKQNASGFIDVSQSVSNTFTLGITVHLSSILTSSWIVPGNDRSNYSNSQTRPIRLNCQINWDRHIFSQSNSILVTYLMRLTAKCV